jgi:hypothetical protein
MSGRLREKDRSRFVLWEGTDSHKSHKCYLGLVLVAVTEHLGTL